MKTLGKLIITVKADDGGNIHTEHETEFSDELSLMQSAMSETEKQDAMRMRREICRNVANFFLAIKYPDYVCEVK